MPIGPLIPLTQDTDDGFTMIYQFQREIRQNFKTLILTHPGERVMEPEFGVGISKYLFENSDSDYQTRIISAINKQVAQYMPVVSLTSITFGEPTPNSNSVSMKIKYSVPDLNIRDNFVITI